MNESTSAMQLQSNLVAEPAWRRINLIITPRSIIVIGFVCYLFISPIYREADIVASVLASSLISILLTFCIATFLYGRKFRRELDLQLFPPEMISSSVTTNSSEVISNEPCTLVLRTSPLRIPPFYRLRISLELYSQDIYLREHQISGASDSERVLVQQVSFPHRGNWHIRNSTIELQDSLGFTSYLWTLTEEDIAARIRVAPPSENMSSVPILSSSDKTGDMLPDAKERKGDPYDLKAYHPSDGIRKILWKIFAKSGELIARHPEASMTPEGQVVVFCLANKFEDATCSAVMAYIKILEDINLEVFFGCEGMHTSHIATSGDAANDLLIESVWATEESTSNSITENMKSLVQQFSASHHDAGLKRIVIFCSRRRLMTLEGVNSAMAVGDYLESIQAKPVFCLIENLPILGESEKIQAYEKSSNPNPIFRYFIRPKIGNKQQENMAILNQFLSLCLSNDWRVVT